MFRLAVETGEDGAVTRVVFLALRGEEGAVECFWPVPVEEEPRIPQAPANRTNSTPALQLPLPTGTKWDATSKQSAAVRRRPTTALTGDAPS